MLYEGICLLICSIYIFSKGQEIVAEQSLDLAAKEGHWVVLQVENFDSSTI